MSFHDPHCPEIKDDGHTPIQGLPMHSVPLTDEALKASDLVLVVTDHSGLDYERVLKVAPLVLDTRGVLKGREDAKLVGLSR